MSELTSMPACFQLGDSFCTDFIRQNPINDPATEIADPPTELLDCSVATHKVRELATDFLAKRAAILGNQMNAPMQNEAQVDRLAQDYRHRAESAIEKGLQDVDRVRAATIEAMTPKELKPVMSSQILQALQTMRADDRHKVLDDMDEEVFSAVFHGHYIAAGLTRAERDRAVERYRARHYRDQIKRLERINKAVDVMVGQVRASTDRFFGNAVDQKKLAAARESAQRAEAALKNE